MKLGCLKIVALSVLALLAMPVLVTAADHSDSGCDGCHTPHGASQFAADLPPLWGQADPNYQPGNIDMYDSTTFSATIDNVPTGSSRLCLSCHDGTDAAVVAAGVSLGTDMDDSHPFSFVYDETADNIVDKATAVTGIFSATTVADMLETGDKVQCSSCHEIHVGGTEQSLRGAYADDPALCRACHEK
ncbi:MAG: cytochrome c3 family protein [Planctomycetota bacterium]|jgi:predicted CXXCH cytochrome family protein